MESVFSRSRQSYNVLALFSFFLFGLATFGYAQNQLVLTRINSPIILDGVLNEKVWDDIEPLPVVMHVPNFGQDPTERTEIFIVYDNEFLYIAGRLYDKEPAKIQSPSKMRDEQGLNNDWFGIVLDTFNDNENGLAFFTTPAGLRTDLAIINDAFSGYIDSWNTFWDVATSKDEKGWYAEFRIPFSSLQFQEKEGKVVMGLISWRFIARKYEWAIFPAISAKWGFFSFFKVSQAQEVVFEGIQRHDPLYFTPFLISGLAKTNELNDEESAYQHSDDKKFEGGLDVKVGLTSNLTMDVTVNTDFAQVEADDQQINLTRFSLFFPEKRLFFQERSSNFEFNLGESDQLFYSRRIGIHNGKPVRIYGGARIVGRIGDWDVGFLNMQTSPVENKSAENFGMLRFRRQVINSNTYLGGIATSRLAKNGVYNAVYGVDGIFCLFRDDYLKTYWAQTFDDSLKNNILSLKQARFGITWEKRSISGIAYDFTFTRSGKNFNPGMGFEWRDNFISFGNYIKYGWIPVDKTFMHSYDVFVIGSVIRNNETNDTESAEIGPGWEFRSKSGYEGMIVGKLYYENIQDTFSISDNTDIPAGQYTYYGLEFNWYTPFSVSFNNSMDCKVGSFYDGFRLTFSVSPSWSVTDNLELSGYYQINFLNFADRNQEVLTHIARFKTMLMLNTKFSISAFVQYNSLIRKVITNLRLRYNPREGNDFYIVYNDDLNMNRYREFPTLPITNSRTVLLKYTYTFNL